MKRTLVAVGSAALLVSALQSVHAAGAPRAVAVTPGALVSGFLTDSSGRAVAGADVRLLAWPRGETVDAQVPGDTGNLTEIARTTTSSTGSYVLANEDSDLVMSFSDQQGNINAEVVATSPSGAKSMYATALRPALGSAAAQQAADEANASDGSTTYTANNPPVPNANLVDGSLGNTAAQETARLSTADPEPTAFDKASCSYQYVRAEGTVTVFLGAHYGQSNVPHDFEYSDTSSNTFGIAVSASAAAGSWKQGGTVTHSAGNAVGFPKTTGRQHDYSKIQYNRYAIRCGALIDHYESRPVSHITGDVVTWTPPTVPSATHCAVLPGGSWYRKTSSKATSSSGGVDVSRYIGIDLSSQSGYTTATSVFFDARNVPGTHYLCGTKDVPGGSPGRLVVK